MRLAFFGTPDFAVPALQALVDAGHEIACVYTQPPRAAGRGEKERRSAVHEAAEKLDLTVRTPQTLKDEGAQANFAPGRLAPSRDDRAGQLGASIGAPIRTTETLLGSG